MLVYAPQLLPWVAAVFISSSGTQPSPYHHYHLPIAITILYAHTHLEDSWLPETDWQLLVSEGLWCVWVPHLLHLIALGLQWLLRLTVRGTLGVVHCIMRGRPPWGVSCTLIVVAMATLFVCSSVSLLLMVVVYALNVSTSTHQGGGGLGLLFALSTGSTVGHHHKLGTSLVPRPFVGETAQIRGYTGTGTEEAAG